MPYLPRLFAAAAVVLGLAFAAGQAKAPPLPAASALVSEAGAKSALPVEKVHRYRYWRWGPRYNYWGPRYYYQPYYYYRPYPYYGYRYWYGPRYRYWW
ncbi:MAG TPA: hypothetical protein VLD66_00545 [Methyloceanibacter sp.]|nr:hypothetical protein [Methyloceanibacter sp.]